METGASVPPKHLIVRYGDQHLRGFAPLGRWRHLPLRERFLFLLYYIN